MEPIRCWCLQCQEERFAPWLPAVCHSCYYGLIYYEDMWKYSDIQAYGGVGQRKGRFGPNE